MAAKNCKNMPKLSKNNTKKNGVRRGIQRYKYNNCGNKTNIQIMFQKNWLTIQDQWSQFAIQHFMVNEKINQALKTQ